jgi:thioesterase domain-containing protein/acyl carrier protein
VPGQIVELEQMPLSANGKIDKKRLPEPRRGGTATTESYIAPRNNVEKRLVEIWEDVLAIRPIGVRDNYFELGGHSMLAVKLISRIEKEFGKRLPLAELFRSPTVEHLTELLLQDSITLNSSLLVPIQPHGSNAPFFCVHAAGGHVFSYFALSRSLGAQQPFYGLQARGLNKEARPHTQIESMATDYIEELRAIESAGPYHLGGWSMGGVIAFEMARQLQQAGEQVALLALIDTRAPTGELRQISDYSLLASFAQEIGLALNDLSVSWDAILQLPLVEQINIILTEAKRTGVVPDDLSLTDLRHFFNIFKTNAEVMKSYVPGVYHGRITLFAASQSVNANGSKKSISQTVKRLRGGGKKRPSEEANEGWAQWTSQGVERVIIPGDHYSVMRPPQVGLLAEHLRAYIEKKEEA